MVTTEKHDLSKPPRTDATPPEVACNLDLVLQAQRECRSDSRHRPALDNLVQRNVRRMKLHAHALRSHGASVGLSFAELHSAACEAFVRAVRQFNASTNPNFDAYASVTMRHAVIDAIFSHLPPRSMLRQRGIIGGMRDTLTRRHGTPPSTEELATATGIAAKRITFLESTDVMLHGIPLDAPRQTPHGEGGTLHEILSGNATDADAMLTDRERVDACMSALSNTERAILYLFFVEEMTHAEIQAALPRLCGTTMAYVTVRSTQCKALAKIRKSHHDTA